PTAPPRLPCRHNVNPFPPVLIRLKDSRRGQAETDLVPPPRHEASMKSRTTIIALAALLGGFSAPALAQSAGDWTIGLGAHQVDPKSGNGSLVDGTLDLSVEADARPTITAE